MTRITTIARAATLALAGLAGAAMPGQADTAYGCRGLLTSGLVASIEGEDGHFFRLAPDLKMGHPPAARTVAQLARLSEALASRGTTLIYVPVPTKALAMPDLLPVEARNLGYDADIAATLYDETVKALRAAGVRTVNARVALRTTRAGAGVFYRADPRLTADGTGALAGAIALELAETPGYAELPKAPFRNHVEPARPVVSPVRALLQTHCAGTLPPLPSERHVTTAIDTAMTVRADPYSFSYGAGTPVVVVGTEIAGQPETNLAGFVSAYAKLGTAAYQVPEAGPLAAISDYLTSEAFTAAPPDYLVWTHPIWMSLAARGDLPMRELIAAAGARCDRTLDFTVDRDGNGRVFLARPLADAGQTLRLDLDRGGQRVRFAFEGPDGTHRIRTVLRHPKRRPGGRFFMPLTGLWPAGTTGITISSDSGFGPAASLSLCDEGGIDR